MSAWGSRRSPATQLARQAFPRIAKAVQGVAAEVELMLDVVDVEQGQQRRSGQPVAGGAGGRQRRPHMGALHRGRPTWRVCGSPLAADSSAW